MRLTLLYIIGFSCNCFSQTHDTIYFDSKWRISEKEMAVYYRIGSVNNQKGQLFYSGSVKDYYMSGLPEMEGLYSPGGQKDGDFKFYFPDGTLAFSGKFYNDMPKGKWKFYYSSGSLKAEIYIYTVYDFVFLSYYNENGDTLLKNGTGKFEWWQNRGDFNHPSESYGEFLFKGQFDNGKRDSTWETYKANNFGEPQLLFREQYEKGVFKTGVQFSLAFYNKPYSKPANLFLFRPASQKFSSTEQFFKHVVFQYSGGTAEENIKLGNKSALAYIQERVQPNINLNYSSLDVCMNELVNILTEESDAIRLGKNYSGDINFTINETGHSSDIKIEAKFTEQQTELMRYLISRTIISKKALKKPTASYIITIRCYTKEKNFESEFGSFQVTVLRYKYFINEK